MSLCLRVLSSQSELMIDVFGDQSRNALANMLAANDNKDGDEVSMLCCMSAIGHLPTN